jgi:hypothetical protein
VNIDVDLVACFQLDSLRASINRDLRERFSRFRVVLVEDPRELAQIDRITEALLEKEGLPGAFEIAKEE